MTKPLNDTLTAIGRQLPAAYLPTVQDPLPREIEDLLLQLVAFEMRKRGTSARPTEQFVMAQLASNPSPTDSTTGR